MRRATFNLNLRRYFINYAREISQFYNISDCKRKLWDKNDPMVLKILDHVACSHCKAKKVTLKEVKK